MIVVPIKKHYARDIQDALIRHSNTIYDDDAPCIKESIAHTLAWSVKVLPLMNDDDPTLENPSGPPKPTLEPLSSELKYALLRDDETWLVVISSSLSK